MGLFIAGPTLTLFPALTLEEFHMLPRPKILVRWDMRWDADALWEAVPESRSVLAPGFLSGVPDRRETKALMPGFKELDTSK